MTRSGLEPKPSQSGSAEGTSVVQARTTSGREPQAATDPAASPPTGAASKGEASRPGLNSEGLPTSQAMREAHQAWADEQITTSSCAFCDWAMEGTALECREAALAHRQVEHPEACIRRPRPKGSRITKKKLRSAGEEEQIRVDAAEANRLRREREQAQMLATIERGRERDRAALAALDGATS